MAIVRDGALTLAQAIAKFRTYVRDEDSVNQAFTDAAITSQLIDVYQKMWVRAGDHRLTSYASGSLWGGTAAAAALPSSYSFAGTTPVFKLLRLYRETGTGAISATPSSSSFPMEKMERHQLMWLQQNRATPTSLPRAYSLERLDNTSSSNLLTYKLRVWPLTNAASNPTGGIYFSGDVVLQPPTSLGDTNDYFDMDVDQTNIMVIAAAAIASSRTGVSTEFVESLWRMIPEDMQEYLNTKQKVDRPQGGAGGEPY